MAEPLSIAKAQATDLALLPALANRHGLITGATGTGKTVSLQTLAEQFSRIGVPVFLADVKGDLSGLGAAGGANAKVAERAGALGIELRYEACPVVFWDAFGKSGHPIRAYVDGFEVDRLETPPEESATHSIPAPPYADGSRPCVFVLENEGFAGTTTIDFTPGG